ncbi:hypothetical protein NHX12_014791 [Muraenolepis orangiensis]|uniref:Uncharacterized protein n=1 Tax=Muraenolepis orangiensis TaxID=630683 RepID=A0A9Q0D980_9TELE|nr:hypothetical protein NHX12_014791 [Muraenolepis orangiensis]
MEPEQVIQVVLYLRALVDYSPQQDPSIPCADAGMAFKRGDVLEIVDQTDALWWQAKKLPSTTSCAGLIPSTNLLRRKQREHWWSQPYQLHTCAQTYEEAFESGSPAKPSACSARCTAPAGSTAASPYEEVVRYQRWPQDPCRLVALMGASGAAGASGVGVNALRRRLIAEDPLLFQGAVPHTTRAPKAHEENGREYNFVTREVFNHMVNNNRFLEHGDYQGSRYGTSLQAVREVLNAGKICLVDTEPNAVQAVRSPELKAFVVLVKPPSSERLRETRRDALISTDHQGDRPFRDEDFQELEEASRRLESQYCQLLDRVLVSEELEASVAELQGIARRAQDEPQRPRASESHLPSELEVEEEDILSDGLPPVPHQALFSAPLGQSHPVGKVFVERNKRFQASERCDPKTPSDQTEDQVDQQALQPYWTTRDVALRVHGGFR